MWVQKAGGAGVDGVAFAPDGRTLYATGDGWFNAWDLGTRERRRLARIAVDDRTRVERLSVSPDGRFLVALQAGTSVACDTATGREYRRGSVPWPQTAAPFRPGHGACIAALDRSFTGLNYWDVSEGREWSEGAPAWLPRPARSFDFSPDGRTVAAVAETGEVSLADLASGEVRTRFTAPRHGRWVDGARFAPDGNTLVLFTPHQLLLWDLARGSVRAEARGLVTSGGAFALNRTLPVFAAVDHNRVLTLFSLHTGKPIRALDLAIGDSVQCVAFSPDGLTCAVGGSGKQFAVFDVDADA